MAIIRRKSGIRGGNQGDMWGMKAEFKEGMGGGGIIRLIGLIRLIRPIGLIGPIRQRGLIGTIRLIWRIGPIRLIGRIGRIGMKKGHKKSAKFLVNLADFLWLNFCLCSDFLSEQGFSLSSGFLAETGFDGFGFFFVAGFCEEGEHVALVGLDTGLVEGVHTEDVAADTASLLEEVDELAEVFLFKCGKGDEDVGDTTVDVCDAGTEFSHLVDFVDVLACDVVETVEVCFVGGDELFVSALLNRDYGLENCAFAFLNPLTH